MANFNVVSEKIISVYDELKKEEDFVANESVVMRIFSNAFRKRDETRITMKIKKK